MNNLLNYLSDIDVSINIDNNSRMYSVSVYNDDYFVNFTKKKKLPHINEQRQRRQKQLKPFSKK